MASHSSNQRLTPSTKVIKKGSFVNKQGLKIVTYDIDAPDPKAIAIGFHGYASFSENDFFSFPGMYYEGSVTEVMNQCNVSLRLFDMQGFGESDAYMGRRAYVANYQDYIEDALQYFEHIRNETDLPIYLCGGSFGGCIAAHTALALGDRCAGALLASAMLSVEENKKQNSHLLPLLTTLDCLIPWMGVGAQEPNMKFPDMVCNDNRQYQGKLRVRMCVELLKAVDDIHSHGTNIECPLLILHSEADTMCEPEGSISLHEKAKSTDKSLHVFPDEGDLWHAILTEPGKQKPFSKIREWFNSRLNNKNDNEPEPDAEPEDNIDDNVNCASPQVAKT